MKQISRKNNNINIWLSIFIVIKKKEEKEKRRVNMLHGIIRLTFLSAGVLGISSFFGTISDSYIIAFATGIAGFIVIVGTARIYNKKNGKPIVKL